MVRHCVLANQNAFLFLVSQSERLAGCNIYRQCDSTDYCNCQCLLTRVCCGGKSKRLCVHILCVVLTRSVYYTAGRLDTAGAD